MKELKQTKVECNSLKSILRLFGYDCDISAVRRDLYGQYESTVIEFHQLVDYLTSNRYKPTTPREETCIFEDQLLDYPIAIFG